MKPAYSMRRGYRVLYLHCEICAVERPFFRVNSWPSAQKKVIRRVGDKLVAQDSPNALPNIPPEARLVNATCMVCGKTANYVVSVSNLARSKYALGDLCSCGLPAVHHGPHLEVLRAQAS